MALPALKVAVRAYLAATMPSGKLKRILFIIGTRPEMIKFAPLILKMRREENFEPVVCFTGQHKGLLDDTAAFFGIRPDHHLNLMRPDQTPVSFLSRSLKRLDKIIEKENPDLVFVQGDTSTVLSGSLAAFYHKVRIAHLEAGLRSHDKFNPYPEEMNRLLCSRLADFHFAPTRTAAENLVAEGLTRDVFVTGNTVIDSLFLCLEILDSQDETEYVDYFNQIDWSKKIVLVTCHRRENFGEPLDRILAAIEKFANRFPEVQIVFPVHPNPNIRQMVYDRLEPISNILLTPSLPYPYLVWILNKSYFVVTDSGGIQEEAPYLDKPVLVLRTLTERVESIQAGTAVLVGNQQNTILENMVRMYEDETFYRSFQQKAHPYGTGDSADQILRILKERL